MRGLFAGYNALTSRHEQYLYRPHRDREGVCNSGGLFSYASGTCKKLPSSVAMVIKTSSDFWFCGEGATHRNLGLPKLKHDMPASLRQPPLYVFVPRIS